MSYDIEMHKFISREFFRCFYDSFRNDIGIDTCGILCSSFYNGLNGRFIYSFRQSLQFDLLGL